MEPAEIIKAIVPLHGEVIPIRTIQETQPPEDFADAYVAEVNVKAASKVIKALDSAIPRDGTFSMGHLRRFAKRNMLPQHLLAAIEANPPARANNGQTLFVVIPPPYPDAETLQSILAPFAPLPRRRSSATPSSRPSSPLSNPSSPGSPEPQRPTIRLFKTRIPVYPPFNINQAENWSQKMWPVIFNPAAPRATVAPPPHMLTRTLKSIKPRASLYLSLARKVGEESKQSGRGRGVGAVIVDPAIEEELENNAWRLSREPTVRWMDAVLSVAGDARYARSEAGAPSQTDRHLGVAPNPASTCYDADLEGGPDLHALMRATELVSRRRRADDEHLAQYADSVLPAIATDPQLSNKLSPLEAFFLDDVCGPSSLPDYVATHWSSRKRKNEWPEMETAPTSWSTSWSDGDVEIVEAVDEVDTPLPDAPPSDTALAESTIPTSTINDEIRQTDSSESSTPPQTSRIRTRSQGGYLCTDLDIYLSHEPCLCCSMGMLLSRFRAVIFPRAGRMPSGGIASEPVVAPTQSDTESEDDGWGVHEEVKKPDEDRLFYGLHWRKELNWRALGFEFVEEQNDEEGESVAVAWNGGGEDFVFHA